MDSECRRNVEKVEDCRPDCRHAVPATSHSVDLHASLSSIPTATVAAAVDGPGDGDNIDIQLVGIVGAQTDRRGILP